VRRVSLSVGLPAVALALLVAIVLSVGVGPVEIAPRTTLGVVSHEILGIGEPGPQLESTVVMSLRLPRILFGALTGAALAVSGAVMQSLFRNPLADPGVIGVSGGASTGAVAAIVLLGSVGASAFAWLVPAAAFLGGLLAVALIYTLARPGRGHGTSRLLLVGIAVGAGFSAITGFLTFVADDEELQSVVFWQMGSLDDIDWVKLAVGAIVVVACTVGVCLMHRKLDALTLGERSAYYLGLDVVKVRRVLIVLTALLTSVTVAFAGTIGFVGLVVPHVVRLLTGPAHRGLLPLTALVGALLIVVADTIARSVAPPAEVPIGLLTSALGAPFFLFLVLRTRERRL
jgi:iron complex transport system permease protein